MIPIAPHDSIKPAGLVRLKGLGGLRSSASLALSLRTIGLAALALTAHQPNGIQKNLAQTGGLIESCTQLNFTITHFNVLCNDAWQVSAWEDVALRFSPPPPRRIFGSQKNSVLLAFLPFPFVCVGGRVGARSF